MAKAMVNGARRKPNGWRLIGWGVAALLLLLPLFAMQFTDEVRWDGADFIFAGAVFGGTGIALEVTCRRFRQPAYRAAVAAALAASFAIIWSNAAVGMIGDGDNVYSDLFLCVIGLTVVGAAIARFHAIGMARTMLAAGVTQLAIAVVGLNVDAWGGILSAAFASLWLLAAALFRMAARRDAPVDTTFA